MKKHYLLGLILILFACACSKNLSEATGGAPRVPNKPVRDTAKTITPADTTTKPRVDTTRFDTAKAALPAAPFPVTVASAPPAPSCPISPIYGDTIIYPQPTCGGDYIVTPLNNPGPGKHISWPVCMVLDPNTVAIN